ncbi:hypothetical protein OZN62_05250 [Aurantiacibacter sp. MUD11]|uniref:hypothetical protein n=1 Tax=Aurantiacibacter sp. MUD11 TaxID=3003265 RepID=UPI0022AAF70B|nr:hypothetical protein [Aurantiacibacter sp. MUD11]WAT18976.1 hypothetical protein OZN62_05250 [Aurantiacibacter sp. MUD11]
MGDSIGRHIPCRTELFAVVLAVAVLNAASHRIIGSLEDGLAAAVIGLFGISAIVWFALYAIVKLGLDSEDGLRASSRDLVVVGLVVLACLLPTRAPAVGAMLGGAAYLFITAARGSQARWIGAITLSLGGPLLLGPLALNLFGTELLPLDAWLGATLAGNPVSGNVIQTSEGQLDLLIMPGCSAFNNLTMVIVLALSLAGLMGAKFGPWLKGGMLVAGLAVVLVNGARLAAMAHYPEHFEWLHKGGGATLFGYATLLVMAPIVGFAVMRSQPDAR